MPVTYNEEWRMAKELQRSITADELVWELVRIGPSVFAMGAWGPATFAVSVLARGLSEIEPWVLIVAGAFVCGVGHWIASGYAMRAERDVLLRSEYARQHMLMKDDFRSLGSFMRRILLVIWMTAGYAVVLVIWHTDLIG